MTSRVGTKVPTQPARRWSGMAAGAALLLAALACAPIPPQLEVTPTSLDFGYLAVGTVAGPLTVTVTNVGTVPASGFGPGTPSDAAFAVDSTCTTTLAPGGACTYGYTFTPTTTEVVEATATLATPAGSFDVALRGAAAASFSVSALELDFGDVGVGDTSPVQTVTIRNHGTTTLAGFAGGAAFDPQFAVSQNCAGGVAPGASCQYFVRFTPTAEGPATTTSNTVTDAGPFVIRLRGTGVGPRLWVTPLALDFGPVVVGVTSPQQVVTIHNTGLATLAGFAGGAPFDPQFGASQNCAGGVASGGSCSYFFDFEPTAVGVAETTSNSGSDAGPFVIDLRGAGVTAPPTGPVAVASPLVLDFGEVGVGTTSPVQQVVIRNAGSETLAGFSGGAPPDGQFQGAQNCAAGVAPGGTCQYSFTFTPDRAGTFTTTSSSGSNGGGFVIELRGTGVGARVWATPLELDFGEVAVGLTSDPLTVTITNVGKATLAGFAGGAPGAPFTATQNCAGGVAPGGSCTYTFRFAPTEAGLFTGTSSSGSSGGGFAIALRGHTPPP